MSVSRWFALILCSASAVAAQGDGKVAEPKLNQPPAAMVPDLVVNGIPDRKRHDWKRAESAHIILIGQGSVDELTRVSRNLELLYQLMSRLYRHGDTSDPTVKLQVVLFESPASFRQLALRNLRSEQGPFLPGFADQSYYDPRDDGAVLAIARSEQIVDLNTVRAFNLDCDEILASVDTQGGAPSCAQVVPTHAPAITSWEQSLYGRFAQHFILTYDPGAYPRWYLDGIGALFSTVEFKGDGAVDYARPKLPYLQVFRSYGDLNVGEVLSGRYLDAAPGKVAWTPYHAWLLAHFFLFSKLDPQRSAQFRHYMTQVRQGVPPGRAAETFGDMSRLQREIMRHAEGDNRYAHAAPPVSPVLPPRITILPLGTAGLIEAKLALDAPLAEDIPDTDRSAPAADILARARGVAGGLQDADGILLAAEAEWRSGRPDDCLADAEKVLGMVPNDARAMSWKGLALVDQAVAAPPGRRAELLALARQTIEHAMTLDAQAPLPRIAYFLSFTRAGEQVPDRAMLAMTDVIRRVPAAPGPRLYLAEALVAQGKADLARRLLDTVVHGPYNSPERRAALRLLASGDGGSLGPSKMRNLR